jgi:hypothetical protein
MDIVDRNPERPSQVRSGLPELTGWYGQHGNRAVEEHVPWRGPLTLADLGMWDEFGARVKLIVNGTDLVGCTLIRLTCARGKGLHEAQRMGTSSG